MTKMLDTCFARCAVATISAAVASFAFGGELPPAVMERPLQAPSVPKAVRDKVLVPAEPTRDQALRDQVERKLRASFDAAAIQHGGSLTLEQARNAGLGYIAHNFDGIDSTKTGVVRFEDVKRFMRARGAQLN